MSAHIQSRVGLSFAKTFKMLRDGVAFISDDRKSYSVYAHDGDHLGDIPRYMVLAVVTLVKQRFGIEHGTILYDRARYHGHPPVTFGWLKSQNEWKPGDWIVLNGDQKTEGK